MPAAGVPAAGVPAAGRWGDASDLIDILDLRPAGANRFVSVVRGTYVRPVVEASQMLGQVLVAAGRVVPGRRPVSAHLVSMRPADALQPLTFDTEELSRGRQFATVRAEVSQSGRRCAAATVLLDAGADDVVRHEAAPPDVAGPAGSEPYDMGVTGREIRVVSGAYTNDPGAPAGPAHIDAWVRFDRVPGDECIHAALLAQFTGHMSIAAALRPHAGVSQADAHRSLSTGINAIALSIHADVRADRWMLYHHESTFAGAGMTHSQCRVHDESGRLLASFAVDAMVRRLDAPAAGIAEGMRL